MTIGQHDDDDEFGSFEGDPPSDDPNDIFSQQPSHDSKHGFNGISGSVNGLGMMDSLNLAVNTSEVMQSLLKPASVPLQMSKLNALPDFSKGDPFSKKQTQPPQSVKPISAQREVPFHMREDKLHPIESIFDISVDEGEGVQKISASNSTPSSVMDLPTLPILMPKLEGSISLRSNTMELAQPKKQVNINELINIDIDEFEHQRPAQPILQSISFANIQPPAPPQEDDDDEFEFVEESPVVEANLEP